MNILVTGANGFTGSHLVNKLKKEHNVISLVHNVQSGASWLKDAFRGSTLVQGDIRDQFSLNRIISRFEIDEVYHTAALAKVKTAYKDPYNTYEVNVMGVISLLEACRIHDVKKTLIMVTDKVYGEGLDLMEDIGFHVSEPYATSKICQAEIAQSYIETYDLDIRMPVCCNIFGYDPYSNRIVPNVVKACLRGESPVIFENDSSIREYVFIEDVLNAFEVIMDEESLFKSLKDDYPLSGLFNLATGNVFNQKELILGILKMFPKLKPSYRTVELPPQIHEETMSSIKWDWKPKWSMSDALKETIRLFEFYKEDWIR